MPYVINMHSNALRAKKLRTGHAVRFAFALQDTLHYFACIQRNRQNFEVRRWAKVLTQMSQLAKTWQTCYFGMLERILAPIHVLCGIFHHLKWLHALICTWKFQNLQFEQPLLCLKVEILNFAIQEPAQNCTRTQACIKVVLCQI